MAIRETAGRMSADQPLELWREYRETEDPRVRDRLVLTFAPIVKYIAYRKVREMPARCDVEDFVSCGLEALIRSIDRYDPDKRTQLKSDEQLFSYVA
jgi:RNA polymerase sigma factor FliA